MESDKDKYKATVLSFLFFIFTYYNNDDMNIILKFNLSISSN